MSKLPRPDHPGPTLSAKERELGMDRDITRRDFINAMVVGTGAALLGSAAPGLRTALAAPVPPAPWHPWTGYGGVGDYASSNGNTWDVVQAGHGIRDARYGHAIATATPTGERYDLVIVGGGFAGVMAAYTFLKETKRQRSCLLLDNHPLIGGEAKRNEFLVRGHRLMGPQGSNLTSGPGAGWHGEMWRDLGLPTAFEFGQLPRGRRAMEFSLDSYTHNVRGNNSENHGYFFDTPRPHWVTNPWGHRLEGTPWPPEVRRDLLRWQQEPVPPFQGDELSLRR